MKGYRTEQAYGSGIRDLKEIIYYEILELNNLDIPYTLKETFDLSEQQEEYLETVLNNEDVGDETFQDIADMSLDIIHKEFPNAKYGLWLASKEVVKDLYDASENEIDEYEIQYEKPISDLGFNSDGCLYVYDEMPKKTNEENINESIVKAYHNTESKFSEFNKEYIGTGAGISFGEGFYFSDSPIDEYGKAMEVELTMNKPFEFDINNKKDVERFLSLFGIGRKEIQDWADYYSNNYKSVISKILDENDKEDLKELKEKGYDSLIIHNTPVGIKNKTTIKNEYVVFEPNQIKIINNIEESLWNKDKTIYQPKQDSKYKRLIRKPINTLTLEEIKYIWKIWNAYYMHNVKYYDSVDEIETWYDDEDFTECYNFCHNLKFPLTIYRGLQLHSIHSDKYSKLDSSKYGRHWTTDKYFFTRGAIVGYGNFMDTILVATINADDVDVAYTISTYMGYSTTRKRHYPENEITVKKEGKDLKDVKAYSLEEFKQQYNINENIKESLNSNKDNMGNKLSKEQVEYFKDSKIRDANGNLMVCYHSSFSKRIRTFRCPAFFTDNDSDSMYYGDNTWEYYLNIKNPFVFTYYDDLDKLRDSKDLKDQEKYEIMDPYDENDLISYEHIIEYVKELGGYDGIILYNSPVSMGEINQYIVFNPNQIKAIKNTNHTKLNNLNESMKTKDSQGNELSLEQIKYFKNSKIRDDNNNLMICYHGTHNSFKEFMPSIGGIYGSGMYFSNSKEYAEGYGNPLRVYLNITNPLIVKNQKELDKYIYDITNKEINDNGIVYSKYDSSINWQEELRKTYDGIIIESPSDDLPIEKDVKFYIALEPNQIKHIRNKKPTSLTKINEAKFIRDKNNMKHKKVNEQRLMEMPYKSSKIKLSQTQDRRRKLTDETKDEIRKRYANGEGSLNSLAREYGVSKSSILITVNPKSAERNKQYTKDHWRVYQQSKEDHAKAIRDTRRYKQSLYVKGELKDDENETNVTENYKITLDENLLEAGYSGYRMSNNAVQAYEDGEKPLSKWTKLDILKAVKKYNPSVLEYAQKLPISLLRRIALYESSWHHTSSYYNKTNFYSIDEEAIEEMTVEHLKDLLNRNKDIKVDEPTTNKYKGTIEYLEWSGSRKHPKATNQKLDNVNIEEKGSFYIVTDDNGNVLLRKKIGSNGTRVTKNGINEDMSDIVSGEQEFTSKSTAHGNGKANGGRGRLPSLFKKVRAMKGDIVLDYGCGEETTSGIAQDYINSLGAGYIGYDKYNKSDEENRKALRKLSRVGGADIAVCANVLNVIKERDVRVNEVIRNIYNLLKKGGIAYFDVYSVKNKEPRQTGEDKYQLFKNINFYVEEIEEIFGEGSVAKRGNVLVANKG